MKGLRDSIANEATIKAGQNYTDASPNNRNEYDSAVTAAKAIINQTSNNDGTKYYYASNITSDN